MKKLIKKDKKNRFQYLSNELNQIVNNYLFRYFASLKIDKDQKRRIFSYLFNTFSVYRSKTKIVRRCAITGRARGTFRITKISRIKTKELIKNKAFESFQKALW
jgi:ribosomal protein S14